MYQLVSVLKYPLSDSSHWPPCGLHEPASIQSWRWHIEQSAMNRLPHADIDTDKNAIWNEMLHAPDDRNQRQVHG